MWSDKNGFQEFSSERACCFIIPPLSGIKIELDYGDEKMQEIGLGSMFGYVGAFEYRYRNHSARVKLVKVDAAAGDSHSSPVLPPVPYLYRIDLKKLKRLKGMNAADERFTHSELKFIAQFRKPTPDFSQIQDNTSLASITEHGKVRALKSTLMDTKRLACMYLFAFHKLCHV